MKMRWRNVFIQVLDIALRVPPLFMIDIILKKNFLSFYYPYDSILTWIELLHWFVVMSGFSLLAVVIFCVDSQRLRELYSYFLSVTVLVASYWCNSSFVIDAGKAVKDEFEAFNKKQSSIWECLNIPNFYQLVFNLSMQISLSQLFMVLRTTRQSYQFYQNNNRVQVLFQSFIYISLTIPLTIRTFYQDCFIFYWSPILALLVPVLQIVMDFHKTLCFTYSKINKAVSNALIYLEQRGIQDFLALHWDRLRVPKVLRLFFVLRLLIHVSYYILHSLWKSYRDNNQIDFNSFELSTEILKTLLVDSCNTLVAVLGLTSMVSLVMYYIGCFMSFCLGTDSEEDKTIGTVSAVLFFVLALQTGLTSLDPDQRLIRLYRNFCLLSTSVLHFVHGMVNPQLLAISASASTAKSKHARALGMCLYLVTFPVCLLIYLWSYHAVNTWLLAVTAFCVEVILKVIFSLLVYALFMIDSYRQVFWEKLDDYVYYVQSTGNTIEFFFGIFLFCNGAWIMMFESGGAIRAVMMCIHAYFNIWLQAKEGWKVFMRRRTAVNKISFLPSATKEQLAEHNDVCSVCYQDLNSARITRCKHFFHSICLRKWLYVQDTCPLCHKNIFASENGGNSEENNRAAPLPQQIPPANHLGAIPLYYGNDPQNNNPDLHVD